MTRPKSVGEFEEQYAARSSMTVAELHSWGRYGEPCSCGDESCEGFAMGHQWSDAAFEDRAFTRAASVRGAGEDSVKRATAHGYYGA